MTNKDKTKPPKNPGWKNVFDIYRYDLAYETEFARRSLVADIFLSRLAKQDPVRLARDFPDCAPFVKETAKIEGKLSEVVNPCHPLYNDLQQTSSLSLLELETRARDTKCQTIDQIRIFTSGRCEATCPKHCFTKQLKGPCDEDNFVLTTEQRKAVIREARDLGANLLYLAGRGEPLLDPGFFDLAEFARNAGLGMLMYTNGLILSNDAHARRTWGVDSDTLIKRLANLGIKVYHKLWSTDQVMQETMMGIRDPDLHYDWQEHHLSDGRKVGIPRGLLNHYRVAGPSKVGVQTVIDANNTQEVRHKIIPLIKETRIKSFVEPFITSGKGAEHPELVPRLEDLNSPPISDFLERGGCRVTAHSMTILEDGTMSFCLSLESERIRDDIPYAEHLQVFRPDGKLKDLWALNHAHPYIVTPVDVTTRYDGFLGICQCQRVNECIHGLPNFYQSKGSNQ